ncbi:SusC/RagA family TonB-linked outer membrane protein [uncultured Bacteroides sp.]|uniref:SusC/RagA family TonB-linked outer membrane protein n=1 Tax=uncultured Bacteroides sp. TaxID=162156 RepID=UPI0025ECB291|nr:SusC/RagA family TonB-linked outer membrane protein [uncultured Bacteroides sp.]
MKVRFISRGLMMLLAFILSFSAPEVRAQSAQKDAITMTANKRPLAEVLEKLSKQYKYQLFYNTSLLKGIRVSASFKNVGIEQVMEKLLAGTGLSYNIKGKTIVITSANGKDAPATTLLKGRVLDKEGQGIPGVNIFTRDKSQGAVSDIDGNFAFGKPLAHGTVLNFTSIGMKTQNIVYDGESTLKIVMVENVNELDAVVVTGVVNKMKESFTGSASSFTADELKAVGTTNAIASLKTLDPSFNVLENSAFGSDPNRMPDIEIRGKSSLISTRDELAEDPNQPLFILDGFESSLETIYNMDMNRIASITILKDAASTAIYGSKASNGVVVVETVKPKSGKLNLSYNGSANISWADLTSYNLMNAREKLEFERLVGRYSNFSGTEQEIRLMQSYNNKLADIARGVDTYWLSEPLQTGLNHRHSVYADGGEGAFMFGIGLSYNGISGVMKDSKRDNFSGNIDLTYRLKKLQFINKFYMDNTDSKNPIVDFSQYAAANPYYTKRNEEGEVEKWLEYTNDIHAANPLYNAAQNSYNTSGGLSLSDKFIIEYMPISEMKVRARFGFTHSNSNSKAFSSPRDTRFEETEYTKRGSYTWNESKNNKYEGELTLTYAKVFKDVHTLNIAAGGYISQQDTKSNGYSAIGFPVGDYTLPSFSNGYPEGGKPDYYETTNRSVSAYAIGNYAYDNRYMLDFSYRVNGSSVFGINKHYIGTWAVGAAWNLHNEKFIKNNFDGVSMLKLRASVGNPGNQNFSSSPTITTFRYNFNSFNYFGMTTSLAQLGNPNLEWQTTVDRNIGFDITVLDNRLTLTGDYYYKTTDPLLISIYMPPSSGATGNMIYKNFGKQTSKGFTAQANYYIIRQMQKRFWWSVRGTLRTGSNKLSGIGNRLESFNSSEREGDNRSTKRFYDGADPDDIWAVRSAGIDPATGREIFIKKNGELTYDFSYDDEVVIANARPTAEGVLGTSFSWKGFSVNMDFRYRMGGYAFNSVLFNKVENISNNQLIYNQDKRALYDRWEKPGDKAQFKDIANSMSTPMSSRFVQKDNSWSLESLRIGYEFDPEVARRFGLGSIRLNAYMNDIFRLTTIKMERGTSYPYARSVSFALSLTL